MTDAAARPVDAVFFDLFGTLVSLAPLDEACETLAPGRGAALAARWRAKQLEVSWLRTVMRRWAHFDAVTADALGATLAELGITADPDSAAAVARAFSDLPLAEAGRGALQTLRARGLPTGVLTNATARTASTVVARARVELDHVLSVDAVECYKPHPDVYRLAVDASGLAPSRIGFVTSNGWDAAGASAFGFRVAWLRPAPTAVVPPTGSPEPEVATWDDIQPLFLGDRP